MNIQEKLKYAVNNILNAIGINNGASHAEFKIDQNGNIFFIEVGARAGVYFLSKEVSYIRTFIEKNKNSKWVIKYHIDGRPLQELRKSQDRSGYIIYQADHRICVS